MTVYEILTIALIAGLAAAATAAIYIGLLGMMGQFYVRRCASCKHFMFAFTDQPQHSCARRRHPVLLHPLHAVHHPGRLATKVR